MKVYTVSLLQKFSARSHVLAVFSSEKEANNFIAKFQLTTNFGVWINNERLEKLKAAFPSINDWDRIVDMYADNIILFESNLIEKLE